MFSLHDLQLSYCTHICSLASDFREALWHERLIRGLPTLLRNTGGCLSNGPVSGVEMVDILNISISKYSDRLCDDYLVDSLVRHMIMAHGKLSGVLRRGLKDFRWIRKKAGRRSLLSAAADYEFVIESIAKVCEGNHRMDKNVLSIISHQF